jgi:hypothetical protein
MAGLPNYPDPNNPQVTSGETILDTNYLTRSQGTTCQNWGSVYLADNSASVGNSSSVQAPGNSDPMDVPGRPGYMQAGEPGGNPSVVIVPETDGNAASGTNILTVSSPAGTAGGGGYYPSGFQSPATAAVPNPMIFPAWTVQAKADEDAPVFSMTALAPSAGSPSSGGSGDIFAVNVTSAGVTITPTFSGDTTPINVVLVEADGVTTSSFPVGMTMVATTGVVTIPESAAAGTYTLAFRANDSSTPVRYTTYDFTVVVTG